MDNEYKPTAFDAQIQSHELQMLKTILPYMEWRQQKSLAVMIKYMELQKTAQIFSADTPSIQMCEITDSREKALQMLNDLSEICTEKEKENIDNLLNMFQMFSTYEILFS